LIVLSKELKDKTVFAICGTKQNKKPTQLKIQEQLEGQRNNFASVEMNHTIEIWKVLKLCLHWFCMNFWLKKHIVKSWPCNLHPKQGNLCEGTFFSRRSIKEE
jgi:hypothetical protein